MRFLLIFLLTFSCAHDTIDIKPKLSISTKNWELIYSNELKSAIYNDDYDAFAFFWPLYLQERHKNKLKTINESDK